MNDRPYILHSHRLTRTFTYDMHGWLTKMESPVVSQQLLYANGAEPSFTGRISAKITDYGSGTNPYRRYDYSYDKLGRLTTAKFSSVRDDIPFHPFNSADFSTSYTYDLHGNPTHISRAGTDGIFPTAIDDIDITYSGNQIASVADNAPTVLSESALDIAQGSWSGSDFVYDANGNLTRDMSRNIANIEYNLINQPEVVEFLDGTHILNIYSPVGVRLQSIVYDADLEEIESRSFCGLFELLDGRLNRFNMAEGYVNCTDSTLLLYVHNYQGNVIALHRLNPATTLQRTDYYHYGMPHADAILEYFNHKN